MWFRSVAVIPSLTSGRCVHAVPGASLSTSINPSLAIHGKSFGPQEAMLLVGCADRASPSPARRRLAQCVLKRSYFVANFAFLTGDRDVETCPCIFGPGRSFDSGGGACGQRTSCASCRAGTDQRAVLVPGRPAHRLSQYGQPVSVPVHRSGRRGLSAAGDAG